VIRAVERVILVSIKGRAKNDEHGPRWYEVNRMKSCNDIDEYELKANSAVFMCEERHQGAGFEEFSDFSARDLCNVLALQ
jgi:hypothetical protein